MRGFGLSRHLRKTVQPIDHRVTDQDLTAEIAALRELLITMFGPDAPLQQREAEYRARHAHLTAEFAKRGLANPLPYRSLWDWHAHCRQDGIVDVNAARARIDRLLGSPRHARPMPEGREAAR